MESFAIIVFIFDRMKMLRLDETDAFIRLTCIIPLQWSLTYSPPSDCVHCSVLVMVHFLSTYFGRIQSLLE